MLETELLSCYIDGLRNVFVVPPGETHQQATVGTEPSTNSHIEFQDMSNRPQHWYNGDDGAVGVNIAPMAA